jgi:TfoX/Sxy family transcriptional regulator of competence genes
MAYDEDLANRIRELLGVEHGLSEMSMFGGLAFLLDGNMSVALMSQGGLLVRTGKAAAPAALARPHASAPDLGGRQMSGWVLVAPGGLKTKRQLASWVRQGVAFARTMPPKSQVRNS